MDASLDELIQLTSAASLGGKQENAGQSSNSRLDESSGRSGGPTRRDRTAARRSKGYNPYTKGVLNVPPTRDVYGETERQQINECLSKMDKIAISNLDFGITSKDLKELFYEHGPLKIVNVHYDCSGNSRGTAEVVFNSNNAALKAGRLYNNVPLAGRRMKIELVLNFSTISYLTKCFSRPQPLPRNNKKATLKTICQYRNVPLDGRPIKLNLALDLFTNAKRSKRYSRPAPIAVRGNHGSGGGFQENQVNTEAIRWHVGRRGRRGGRRIEQTMPNKEELDAQLDDFMKSKIN